MAEVPELAAHHISPECGFLLEDPQTTLPEYFAPWEKIAKSLIELMEEKKVRDAVRNLPLLDHTKLRGYKEVRLGYNCLCFITSCYVWQDGDKGVTNVLPRQLAIPLTALAGYLGAKPVFNYDSLVLANWKKIDPNGPLHYTNIDFIIKITSDPDYTNFLRVSFQMEMCAVPGIKACVDALKAVLADDKATVIKSLETIRQSVLDMLPCFDIFKLIDPDYFYFSFGPLATGWGGEHSALPDGLIYEGVNCEPVKSINVSAGQTPILHSFDATLGILHNEGAKLHLDDMLWYMPLYNREFVIGLRQGPSLKNYVAKKMDPELSDAYNNAVGAIVEFRSAHIRIAASHVVIPSKKEEKRQAAQKVAAKPELIPGIMGFLKTARDGTSSHMVD